MRTSSRCLLTTAQPRLLARTKILNGPLLRRSLQLSLLLPPPSMAFRRVDCTLVLLTPTWTRSNASSGPCRLPLSPVQPACGRNSPEFPCQGGGHPPSSLIPSRLCPLTSKVPSAPTPWAVTATLLFFCVFSLVSSSSGSCAPKTNSSTRSVTSTRLSRPGRPSHQVSPC